MKKVFEKFKTIWIFLWLGVATGILFWPIFFTAIFSKTGNLPFTVSKAWCYTILFVTRVKTSIRGRENITPGQSYIIISNHQSHFDILALITRLKIQFRWIIKKEILKAPLFGQALLASKNIFIDRSNHEKALESIQEGLDRLPKGVSVMVFAEGTRSIDGSIGPFKKGGFHCALQKHLPILPVTVNGSRRLLPKNSLVFNSGKMEVVVGKPIETTGYTTETILDLMEKTRKAIIKNFNPYYK